jgi:hypothetical protein
MLDEVGLFLHFHDAQEGESIHAAAREADRRRRYELRIYLSPQK